MKQGRALSDLEELKLMIAFFTPLTNSIQHEPICTSPRHSSYPFPTTDANNRKEGLLAHCQMLIISEGIFASMPVLRMHFLLTVAS